MVMDVKWTTVTIILQYMQILGHYVVHLKLVMLDVHHTSLFLRERMPLSENASELVLGKNHDLLNHMPGSLISSSSGNKETKK